MKRDTSNDHSYLKVTYSTLFIRSYFKGLMTSTAADITRENKNLIQNTSGIIASVGLNQVGKRVAGNIVTPATWALNYAADGSTPGKEDLMLFSAGFAALSASVVVGTLKAVVDDRTKRQLQAVKQKENPIHRKHIKACVYLDWSPSPITASKIASAGGTAWLATNGLWCFITDAKGHHICDYTPNSFLKLYQPSMPLSEGANGGFLWEVRKN
ncbi:hypothetical protein [Halioxenophilus aromaticivorans]|uniref:hypothetical protein n=1 Tax=Halioxenophilus aromaticivorans TaxID=1306992 RepID=UPI0036F2A863